MGSPWVGDNDLTLHCNGLPNHSFGFFIVSREPDSVPLVSGEGTLCLGGSIGRFNQDVRYTGMGDSIEVGVNLGQIASPFGPFAIGEGELLRFQYYYRDPFASGAIKTNMSAGARITFACDSVTYDGDYVVQDIGQPALRMTPVDWDGDGDSDLIGYYPGNDFFVLENTGSGSFSPLSPDPVLSGLDLPAFGDIDGDGDLDVFGTTPGQDLGIFLGDGTGGFSHLTSIAVGTNPGNISMADMDGNGTQDLVVNRLFQQSVSIFLTQPGVLPLSHLQVSIGTNNAQRISTQDFNGDGMADLFAERGAGPNTVSLRLNLGNATFSNPTTIPVIGDWVGEGQDLDGDGDLDLLFDSNFGTEPVRSYLNDGQGGFPPGVPFSKPPQSNAVSWLDAEGDGDLDLVFMASSPDRLHIGFNDGLASFSMGPGWDLPFLMIGVATADFDGDGDADVVGTELFTPNMFIARNQGDGSFPGPNQQQLDMDPVGVAADFDQDGDLDLVALDQGTNGSYFFVENKQDGTLTRGTTDSVSGFAHDLKVGDWNHDGLPDIGVVKRASFSGGDLVSLTTQLGDGAGGFGPQQVTSLSPYVVELDHGDVDGDDIVDLVELRFFTAVTPNLREIVVRPGLGDGTFGLGQSLTLPNDTEHLRLGDLDGDGDLDLVLNWFYFANGNFEDELAIYWNDGLGGFSPSGNTMTSFGFFRDLILFDQDQDGDLDIAHLVLSELRIFTNDGLGGFSAPLVIGPLPTGTLGVDLAVADLDLDGDLDLVTARENPERKVLIIENLGAGDYAALVELSTAGVVRKVLLADFTGTGRPDVLVVNSDEELNLYQDRCE